ncbi:unnamed protein product [Paramecium octaurelia]|uniref:Uncharacterized protein n=1 Tax=Paramecium octaurelia TaxID=43137 RepID=A0A8S1VJ88_PAROT|nr:unnamed protein product [Paramecium octaurelia]
MIGMMKMNSMMCLSSLIYIRFIMIKAIKIDNNNKIMIHQKIKFSIMILLFNRWLIKQEVLKSGLQYSDSQQPLNMIKNQEILQQELIVDEQSVSIQIFRKNQELF